MPVSLGVWARNWGNHQRILCGRARSCSCTKQATHPPLHARLIPLHAPAFAQQFPFSCLPFGLSLNAEAYPDFVGPEMYSIWDSLFKRKNAKIYCFGTFSKNISNTSLAPREEPV